MAVNRALKLVEDGRRVTLVDLDIVEPCYTLRPIKKELEKKGLVVLAWETGQAFGMGETGNVLLPAARWALRRQGDIILDVGYGVGGTRTLKLVENSDIDPDLRVIAVINISRPMTGTVEDVVSYVRSLGRVHGMINNTHLGDETTAEIVQEGARVVTEAGSILGIPVIASTVMREVAPMIGERDCCGNPVWVMTRYMPGALW